MSNTGIDQIVEEARLNQRIGYLVVAGQYTIQALPIEHKPITDKINMNIKRLQKEIKELNK